MIVTLSRGRFLAPVLLVLTLPLFVSCSAADTDTAEKPETVSAPTDGPFSVDITGPDTATAGQTVTATLTNKGRLPDGYLLVSDPTGDATIAEPNVKLGPGESADVTIQVVTVPVLIRVQSISGGSGATQTYLSIGEQQ